jgi:hypothetical protein
MVRLLTLVLLAAVGPVAASAQAPTPTGMGKSPKEIVVQMWKLATEGEFLGREGWNRYSGFFLHPSPFPEKEVLRVVSNRWGVESDLTKDSHAEVAMEYADEGLIDSALHYTPPQETGFFKTALVFHLTLAPTHPTMLQSDGRVITGKEEKTGPMAWQIADSQDPPFTTVNTAIRYVLEMREKTTDPNTRKNADQTLARLLKLR